MLFDIAIELKEVQSDPVILWGFVNSLGGDTQFYEILGGGIYYESYKLVNVTDLPI